MESRDEYFLKLAIDLAIENVESGKGGPFGAVVVKNGEVIATGQNSVTQFNDPTAHAEIVAIRNASKKLDSFQLEGCLIYSSCEPCPMCLGAIFWSRASKLVFAADKHDAAKAGFDDSLFYHELSQPINKRMLETIHLRNKNHFAPFTLWMSKIDKKEY